MLRAACLAFALGIAATGPAKAEPLFAANAQEIYDSLQSGAAIPSPDGRSTVRPRGEYADHIELVVEGSIGNAIIPLGPGVGSELLWRDDGRAFAVTTSDQGLNGAYRTIVVERRASGLKMADVTRAIYDAFGQPVRCDWPEAPNVAALAWDASDGSLIVAAQIIATRTATTTARFEHTRSNLGPVALLPRGIKACPGPGLGRASALCSAMRRTGERKRKRSDSLTRRESR